jgi:hypothetical protein
MRCLPASLIASLVFGAVALAGPDASSNSQCFLSRNFESWKAPDAKTIYIRVNVRDYYRLDLGVSCPSLLWPSVHLITKWHGSDFVCTAIDWDLKVAHTGGDIVTPCIVKKMTKLSPSEAAAIPAKFKP